MLQPHIDASFRLSQISKFFLPPLELDETRLSLNSILELSRERIITTMLRFSALFGLVALVAIFPTILVDQTWGSYFIDWVILLSFLFLALNRKLSYRIRSAIFLACVYLFLFSLLQEADNNDIVFFGAVFMVTILTFLLQGFYLGTAALVTSMLFVNQYVQVQLIYPREPVDSVLLSIGTIFVPLTVFIAITVAPIFIILIDLQQAWRLERTAAKALQQERRELKDSIEREQLLRDHLENALQSEVALNEQQAQIITTISHEFRTPLAIINQSTTLLTKYAERLTAVKKNRHKKTIEAQVKYMDSLLRDILAVNSTLDKKLVHQPVDVSLDDLVFQVNMQISRLEREHIQLGHSIEETAVSLLLDLNLYSQIISHLLSNAAKFSDPSRPIQVSLAIKAGHLISTVKDEGIGIISGEESQIFELFGRGSNIEARRGMGIGLYIASKSSQLMGGFLTVASPGQDQGSHFSFHLPISLAKK